MLENYKRILVPIDGSKQSERALKQAVEIAERNQAEMVMAMIVDDNVAYMTNTYRSGIKEGMTIRANEILDQFEKIAKRTGFNQLEKVVDYGRAKQVISDDLVKKHDIDLIIMASTGMGATSKLLIGSTSEYVIRHAHCDVLIVKEKED